jgi:hypothetical protein
MNRKKILTIISFMILSTSAYNPVLGSQTLSNTVKNKQEFIDSSIGSNSQSDLTEIKVL